MFLPVQLWGWAWLTFWIQIVSSNSMNGHLHPLLKELDRRIPMPSKTMWHEWTSVQEIWTGIDRRHSAFMGIVQSCAFLQLAKDSALVSLLVWLFEQRDVSKLYSSLFLLLCRLALILQVQIAIWLQALTVGARRTLLVLAMGNELTPRPAPIVGARLRLQAV